MFCSPRWRRFSASQRSCFSVARSIGDSLAARIDARAVFLPWNRFSPRLVSGWLPTRKTLQRFRFSYLADAWRADPARSSLKVDCKPVPDIAKRRGVPKPGLLSDRHIVQHRPVGRCCSGKTAGVPIVLLTGEASPVREGLALGKGAIDVNGQSRSSDVLARRLKDVVKAFGRHGRAAARRRGMTCGKLLLGGI